MSIGEYHAAKVIRSGEHHGALNDTAAAEDIDKIAAGRMARNIEARGTAMRGMFLLAHQAATRGQDPYYRVGVGLAKKADAEP